MQKGLNVVIENPIVIDSLWREKEREPSTIAECSGCQEDIKSGDDVYKFVDARGDIIRVHQDQECCQQYVAEISVCETAGE